MRWWCTQSAPLRGWNRGGARELSVERINGQRLPSARTADLANKGGAAGELGCKQGSGGQPLPRCLARSPHGGQRMTGDLLWGSQPEADTQLWKLPKASTASCRFESEDSRKRGESQKRGRIPNQTAMLSSLSWCETWKQPKFSVWCQGGVPIPRIRVVKPRRGLGPAAAVPFL